MNPKQIPKEIKSCLECGDPIEGRSDKKFCSDPCRVRFHNRLTSVETNYIRNVNNTLRRNRRVLVELNTTGKSKVSRQRLTLNGFDFNYFTSLYKTKDGAIYYYCYEQGYLPIEKEQYLLVVKKDY